jgi:hypothetical protein
MDKTVLVEQDIKEGERLLRALDQAEVPVTGALWLYRSEADVWRYVIASPLVEQEGPLKTYARIDAVLASTSPPIAMPLGSISARGLDDPLINELRLFAGTPGRPFVGGIPLSKSPVGDVYVEDAYIYRMEGILGWSGTVDMLFAVPQSDKRKWQRRPGKMTARDGFITDLEIENYTPRTSQSRNGINAIFYVFPNIVVRQGKMIGDVQKMIVREGRLRSVEDVARGVEILDEATAVSP